MGALGDKLLSYGVPLERVKSLKRWCGPRAGACVRARTLA